MDDYPDFDYPDYVRGAQDHPADADAINALTWLDMKISPADVAILYAECGGIIWPVN